MSRLLYITKEMTMSDAISRNEKLLTIIRRFHIPLGFKDKSIEELAKEHSIDIDLLLLVMNMFNDNSIYISNISNPDIIPELIDYLKSGHLYYRDEKLPYIHSLITKFVEASQHSYSKLLLEFFEEYRREFLEHLRYEDSSVYPYIISKYNISKSDKCTDIESIEDFSEHHSDIESKLDELKMLLIKHFPPTADGGFYRELILLELFNLEHDLSDHTILEDRVLVPLVKLIE